MTVNNNVNSRPEWIKSYTAKKKEKKKNEEPQLLSRAQWKKKDESFSAGDAKKERGELSRKPEQTGGKGRWGTNEEREREKEERIEGWEEGENAGKSKRCVEFVRSPPPL